MICGKGRRRRPFPVWGGIWGSNPRHPEPQSGALPTELIPPSMDLYAARILYKIKAQRSGFDFERTSSGASELSSRRGSETMRSLRGRVARQEGFEPPTYCLEGSCSILLSYWRIYFPHQRLPHQIEAQRSGFDLEKEEGASGYGAFAAPAEAEWSLLPPTWSG